jgi:hypothetical protein
MNGQMQGFCASFVSAAVARSRLSSPSSRECVVPSYLFQLVKNAICFYLLFTTSVMLILKLTNLLFLSIKQLQKQLHCSKTVE